MMQQRQQSASPNELPLPPGWVVRESKSRGGKYYHNVATGVTNWEFPEKEALQHAKEVEQKKTESQERAAREKQAKAKAVDVAADVNAAIFGNAAYIKRKRLEMLTEEATKQAKTEVTKPAKMAKTNAADVAADVNAAIFGNAAYVRRKHIEMVAEEAKKNVKTAPAARHHHTPADAAARTNQESTLPEDGWIRRTSSSGKSFYQNQATNETQWEFPHIPKGWERLYSTTNKHYYYLHTATKTMQYGLPKLVQPAAAPGKTSTRDRNPASVTTDSTSVPSTSPATLAEMSPGEVSPADAPNTSIPSPPDTAAELDADAEEWPED